MAFPELDWGKGKKINPKSLSMVFTCEHDLDPSIETDEGPFRTFYFYLEVSFDDKQALRKPRLPDIKQPHAVLICYGLVSLTGELADVLHNFA